MKRNLRTAPDVFEAEEIGDLGESGDVLGFYEYSCSQNRDLWRGCHFLEFLLSFFFGKVRRRKKDRSFTVLIGGRALKDGSGRECICNMFVCGKENVFSN